jgi:probable phosphoglycerate mutase
MGATSMVELLLTRHGESESNRARRLGGRSATPLTANGRRQAAQLAATLVREGGLTAIYSSDLLRARDTATHIGEATGVDVRLTSTLRERCLGEFTGLTHAEAQARDADAFEALIERRDQDARAPGGENAGDVLARLSPLIAELLAYPTGRILVVAHAFTLNVMLRALLRTPSGVGYFTDSCALHRLELHAGQQVFARALNDTCHLGPDLSLSIPVATNAEHLRGPR